jgi:hypothetical protein
VIAGVPEPRATLLATIAMSVLAGMQQLIRPADADTVRDIFDQLETWFLADESPASTSDPTRGMTK